VSLPADWQEVFSFHLRKPAVDCIHRFLALFPVALGLGFAATGNGAVDPPPALPGRLNQRGLTDGAVLFSGQNLFS
jgi:hypothetical protein